MDTKIISSWVRQTRHRARKHNIVSDVEIADVLSILECWQECCAYCKQPATAIDSPFPLKNSAPHVPANILPICSTCKAIKKTNDLIWMFDNKHITRELLLFLVECILKRRGGDLVREHMKLVVG